MKDWKIIVRKVFLLPVYFYRVFISPLTPPACRFTPTCSQYMVEAVLKYGIFKGTWLGIKRICRCHPWGGSGHSVREAESVVTQADSLWQAGLLPSTLFGQQYIHFPNPQKEY